MSLYTELLKMKEAMITDPARKIFNNKNYDLVVSISGKPKALEVFRTALGRLTNINIIGTTVVTSGNRKDSKLLREEWIMNFFITFKTPDTKDFEVKSEINEICKTTATTLLDNVSDSPDFSTNKAPILTDKEKEELASVLVNIDTDEDTGSSTKYDIDQLATLLDNLSTSDTTELKIDKLSVVRFLDYVKSLRR